MLFSFKLGGKPIPPSLKAYPKSFLKRKDFWGLLYFNALGVVGFAVTLDEENAIAEELMGYG